MEKYLLKFLLCIAAMFFLSSLFGQGGNDDINCTEEYAPVCSCEGITYSNSCYADKDGITCYTEGVCAKKRIPEVTFEEYTVEYNLCSDEYMPSVKVVSYTPDVPIIWELNGEIVSKGSELLLGALTDAGIYSYDVYQESETMISKKTTLVVIAAECEQNDCIDPNADKGKICLDVYEPVCGCDGKTYSNECYAQREGVKVYYAGECSERMTPITFVNNKLTFKDCPETINSQTLKVSTYDPDLELVWTHNGNIVGKGAEISLPYKEVGTYIYEVYQQSVVGETRQAYLTVVIEKCTTLPSDLPVLKFSDDTIVFWGCDDAIPMLSVQNADPDYPVVWECNGMTETGFDTYEMMFGERGLYEVSVHQEIDGKAGPITTVQVFLGMCGPKEVPAFNFPVDGPCEDVGNQADDFEGLEESLSATIIGGKMRISASAIANCCGEFSFDIYTSREDTVLIDLRGNGLASACNCLCVYDGNFSFPVGEGEKYTVILNYGQNNQIEVVAEPYDGYVYPVDKDSCQSDNEHNESISVSSYPDMLLVNLYAEMNLCGENNVLVNVEDDVIYISPINDITPNICRALCVYHSEFKIPIKKQKEYTVVYNSLQNDTSEFKVKPSKDLFAIGRECLGSGEKSTDPQTITGYVQNDSLFIDAQLYFNCCGEHYVDVQVDREKVSIVPVEDESQACKCFCLFDVEFAVPVSVFHSYYVSFNSNYADPITFVIPSDQEMQTFDNEPERISGVESPYSFVYTKNHDGIIVTIENEYPCNSAIAYQFKQYSKKRFIVQEVVKENPDKICAKPDVLRFVDTIPLHPEIDVQYEVMYIGYNRDVVTAKVEPSDEEIREYVFNVDEIINGEANTEKESIRGYIDGETMYLNANLTFNCCGLHKLRANIKGDTITLLSEEDTTEACWCYEMRSISIALPVQERDYIVTYDSNYGDPVIVKILTEDDTWVDFKNKPSSPITLKDSFAFDLTKDGKGIIVTLAHTYDCGDYVRYRYKKIGNNTFIVFDELVEKNPGIICIKANTQKLIDTIEVEPAVSYTILYESEGVLNNITLKGIVPHDGKIPFPDYCPEEKIADSLYNISASYSGSVMSILGALTADGCGGESLVYTISNDTIFFDRISENDYVCDMLCDKVMDFDIEGLTEKGYWLVGLDSKPLYILKRDDEPKDPFILVCDEDSEKLPGIHAISLENGVLEADVTFETDCCNGMALGYTISNDTIRFLKAGTKIGCDCICFRSTTFQIEDLPLERYVVQGLQQEDTVVGKEKNPFNLVCDKDSDKQPGINAISLEDGVMKIDVSFKTDCCNKINLGYGISNDTISFTMITTLMYCDCQCIRSTTIQIEDLPLERYVVKGLQKTDTIVGKEENNQDYTGSIEIPKECPMTLVALEPGIKKAELIEGVLNVEVVVPSDECNVQTMYYRVSNDSIYFSTISTLMECGTCNKMLSFTIEDLPNDSYWIIDLEKQDTLIVENKNQFNSFELPECNSDSDGNTLGINAINLSEDGVLEANVTFGTDCCNSFELVYEIVDDTIVFGLIGTEIYCDCMCTRTLSFQIENLPLDTYVVKGLQEIDTIVSIETSTVVIPYPTGCYDDNIDEARINKAILSEGTLYIDALVWGSACDEGTMSYAISNDTIFFYSLSTAKCMSCLKQITVTIDNLENDHYWLVAFQDNDTLVEEMNIEDLTGAIKIPKECPMTLVALEPGIKKAELSEGTLDVEVVIISDECNTQLMQYRVSNDSIYFGIMSTLMGCGSCNKQLDFSIEDLEGSSYWLIGLGLNDTLISLENEDIIPTKRLCDVDEPIDSKIEEKLDFDVENSIFYFDYIFVRNCCADYAYTFTLEDSTVTVSTFITNDPEPCDCECPNEAAFKLEDFSFDDYILILDGDTLKTITEEPAENTIPIPSECPETFVALEPGITKAELSEGTLNVQAVIISDECNAQSLGYRISNDSIYFGITSTLIECGNCNKMLDFTIEDLPDSSYWLIGLGEKDTLISEDIDNGIPSIRLCDIEEPIDIDTSERLKYGVESGSFYFEYVFEENCCAEYAYTYSVVENTITVNTFVTNAPAPLCDCMCPNAVIFEINEFNFGDDYYLIVNNDIIHSPKQEVCENSFAKDIIELCEDEIDFFTAESMEATIYTLDSTEVPFDKLTAGKYFAYISTLCDDASTWSKSKQVDVFIKECSVEPCEAQIGIETLRLCEGEYGFFDNDEMKTEFFTLDNKSIAMSDLTIGDYYAKVSTICPETGEWSKAARIKIVIEECIPKPCEADFKENKLTYCEGEYDLHLNESIKTAIYTEDDTEISPSRLYAGNFYVMLSTLCPETFDWSAPKRVELVIKDCTPPLPQGTVVLSEKEISINQYQTATISAKVEINENNDREYSTNVIWSILDPSVIEIEMNGNEVTIKPLSIGTTKLVATWEENNTVSATAVVSVREDMGPNDLNILIDGKVIGKRLQVYVGDEVDLDEDWPIDVNSVSCIEWLIEDGTSVEITDAQTGIIKAVEKGKSVIRGKCPNALWQTKSLNVHVFQKRPAIVDISISNDGFEITLTFNKEIAVLVEEMTNKFLLRIMEHFLKDLTDVAITDIHIDENDKTKLIVTVDQAITQDAAIELDIPAESIMFADGCYIEPMHISKVSSSTGIDTDSMDVNVYPNPVHKELIVECSNEIIGITITNILGIEKSQQIGGKKVVVDVSDLPKGTYTIIVKTIDGNAERLFIKQ